ncbi:MAG: hypothetical protein EBZ76_07195 [Synechococcaceae bacterium WB9_2_170]|nr:hypothetical protein [Synechococcaceae bacterium WB9_2_170]
MTKRLDAWSISHHKLQQTALQSHECGDTDQGQHAPGEAQQQGQRHEDQEDCKGIELASVFPIWACSDGWSALMPSCGNDSWA